MWAYGPPSSGLVPRIFSIVTPQPHAKSSFILSPLPENKPLFLRSLPEKKTLFPRSLPENKLLFPRRLPENNLFLKGIYDTVAVTESVYRSQINMIRQF
jgi:hypothetical protein